MKLELRRRDFIRLGVASSLALGLVRLTPGSALRAASTVEVPPYRDWRDVYRQRWRWDRVVRGTHTNTNCVSACAWDLYVREGIVWREEQRPTYEASNASLPDWNPRGCNKGACASALFLGPSRLLHPLKRVGPRGSGRWKRVSWDEALDEIAAVLVDEVALRGGGSVICELGPNIDLGPHSAAPMRFFRLLGAPMTDSMGMIGDLAVGGTITLGTPHTDGSSDDWFRSDHVVLWAFNPAATRIADAHFLHEARYRGARLTVVAPDYNQSAIHADLWLPVAPGSDAALALAACQVILEEGLHDGEYVREQTDLPFLVRADNGHYLRESDLRAAGSTRRFVIWDERSNDLAFAPGSEGDPRRTLRLGDLRPALETEQQIRLPDGRQIVVETVLRRLRRQLNALYTPERTSAVIGLEPGTVRRFARELAAARTVLILSQWGSCKNFHSDLVQRAQILLVSLTGNLGKPGGGWRSGAFLALEGFGLLTMQEKLGLPSLLWLMLRSKLWPEELRGRFSEAYVSSTLFHAVHAGLGQDPEEPPEGAHHSAPGGGSYLERALRAGHIPIGPPPKSPPPPVILSVFGNVLRHARSYPRLREKLFAPARLIVDVNFRLSETGRHADFLLPAAGWYEKLGLKYIPAFVPYVTLADRAVPPRGESRAEWEIFSRLAARVAARARKRKLGPLRSWRGDPIDLRTLDRAFSDSGRFGPHEDEAALEFILRYSSPSSGMSLEDLRRTGALRIRSLGMQGGTAGVYSEYSQDQSVHPLGDFVTKKRPYPTLTGRQQFYLDHPWFLELGEALPTFKPPPHSGGDHPLVLTGGHTRWSIHAQWRDDPLLLRLQRGEPLVHLNPRDCSERGIGDHDRIVVRNDLGSFRARACSSAAIRPGQAHIFHAWEPYQFAGQHSHQALVPSPIKATQLVADYGQLHWDYAHYEPNQVDRDTRVEIELDRESTRA
ncbi:MAG: molybdopterin-dependent oxidoreductase [Myxococcota bacterium]